MRLDSGFTMYGVGRGQPTICITKPYNGKAAEPGNGNMVAIVVKERAQVDKLHAKALALGGADEGAPGVRGKRGRRRSTAPISATSTATSSAPSA